MFIIFTITLAVIHLQVTTIDQIQIIIWISMYLVANFLIGFHPFSFKWNIIRILSIIMILYLSYRNLDQTIYLTSLLIPLSKNEINYVHDFDVKSLNVYKKQGTVLYIINLTLDLTEFINNLNEDDNYWACISFYPNIGGYSIDDGMQLFLSDPILINKDSDPLLLTQFIMNKLHLMIDMYYFDDSIINSQDSIIVIKFTEIELA
jgi:hypothetical protein